METTAVNSSAAEGYTQIASNNALGKDAFLKLLITQLRNQDPLQPMEDKEFIAQLAQFSSLEQMQSMNRNLEMLIQSQSGFSSVGLLGRTVDWIDYQSGEVMSGRVDCVAFENGSPYLKVGDNEVTLDYVTKVY